MKKRIEQSTKRIENRKSIWFLTPIFGILIFIFLYFLATQFYPGGSQIDQNSIGFSWINNYWCNLLNETAINGKINSARPIALAGMIVLCLTLSVFWFLFPRNLNIRKSTKIIIQISGILSMIIAMFIFTKYHDIITNLASLFGVIALIGVFIILYKIKWNRLFRFGMFNLFIVGINNYVYYNNELITYLPVIQKLSFASFLIWICLISINLYNKTEMKPEAKT
jgi:hypothetical protein